MTGLHILLFLLWTAAVSGTTWFLTIRFGRRKRTEYPCDSLTDSQTDSQSESQKKSQTDSLTDSQKESQSDSRNGVESVSGTGLNREFGKTDDLTGLYNRHYLIEYVEAHWNTAISQGIAYLDIDDFRLINELYDKRTGDEVLKWCAGLIQGELKDFGMAFRMASNEFVLFFQNKSKEKILALVQRIRVRAENMEDVNRPMVMRPIHFSVGVSMYPDTAGTPKELLRQAEKMVFFIKRNGKNQVKIYESGSEEAIEDVSESSWYQQVAPTVYALTAAIDAKDSYTYMHSQHVSNYAVILGKALDLNESEIQILKEAGLLHDIGKIGVPERLLLKRERLTEEEFDVMKNHVSNSTEIIHYLPNMSYVIPAVLSHHERYDGTGYPRGLKGEEIPLLGRILALCDSFDAMTTKRVYNVAKSVEEAIMELRANSGTQFDPVLVEKLIELIHDGKIRLTT